MRTLQVTRRERRESLEHQVANLERWGIRLREGLDPAALAREYGRRYLETIPYTRLLIGLGDVDPVSGMPNSPDVCHLRTAARRGPTSYVRIIERLQELSSGSLPLDAVEQEADPAASLVRVRIRVDTRLHEWVFQQREEGWDPALLSRVAQLQRAQGLERCYSVADLGGEGCLIGCFTAPQLYLLRNGTGLGWRWLG